MIFIEHVIVVDESLKVAVLGKHPGVPIHGKSSIIILAAGVEGIRPIVGVIMIGRDTVSGSIAAGNLAFIGLDAGVSERTGHRQAFHEHVELLRGVQ
jgi:hypothetical protein